MRSWSGTRHATAETLDPFMDTLRLTADGARASPNCNVWMHELACSGTSAYGERSPNCFRECGTVGACAEGCTRGDGRHHLCAARTVIKASVDDVRNGQFRVTMRDAHTPAGVVPLPPPPRGRRVAPHLKSALAAQCLSGAHPVQAVNRASAALGAHPQTSSRFVPPAIVAARAVKIERRKDRGNAPTDEMRVDALVREHLIQQQCVLLYEPDGILVLTSPAALEAAFRSGNRDVASDAKVDVVTGQKVKWSTIRGRSQHGRWVPFVIWISEHENTETVTAAARAQRSAVRCSDAQCTHDWQCTYGAGGRFKMERVCVKSYVPRRVCVDKHMPSIAGFRAVFGTVSLCTFHVFRCVEDKMKKLGIKGWKARQLAWAFRLIKRARTHAHAGAIFKEVVLFVMGGVIAQPEALWTYEQACEFVDYLRRCWMYPHYMRMAWIDASGIGVDGNITTTGAQEGAHAYLEKFITGGTVLQLVSQAVTATVGTTANGRTVPSVFGDAVQRCAEGQPVEECPGAKLRRAKAQLQYLRLGAGAAKPPDTAPAECTAVALCDDDCLAAHAESWANRRGGSAPRPARPPALDQAVAVVAHGGSATGTCGAGWYSVCNETGRCECDDSLYRGVLAAEGPCKHELLRRLCVRAAAAHAQVEAECLAGLASFVHARERSKPRLQRCNALYGAAADGCTKEGLLSALAGHQSVPPTGKGYRVGEQSSDASSASDASDASNDDDVSLLQLYHSSREELSCTFGAGPLGAVLCTHRGGFEVAAFAALPGGARGPAEHSGATLRTGDIVTHVNGTGATEAALGGSAAEPVAPAGGAVLRFTRAAAPAAVAVPGGRRSKKLPKFGGGTKRKRSEPSSPCVMGGSVARVRANGKDRPSATDLPAVSTPTPSAEDTVGAIAAMVSVSPEGAARTVDHAVLAAAQEKFTAEMDAEELAAREAEMAGATYLE